MDFRDRKVIKTIEFLISQSKELPLVLYNEKNYSRMNDNIHQSINRNELIVMPMKMPGKEYYPFIVVGRSYEECWNTLCATLKKELFAIAKHLREKEKKLLNIDAMTRGLNRFRTELEKEVSITLEPLVIEVKKEEAQ